MGSSTSDRDRARDATATLSRPVVDALRRPMRNLRVSVIDRCNLRCRYCMPEEEYRWLPRSSLLTFEEIGRLVEVFAGLGVDRVRLTGGEPLLRNGLPELVAMLAALPGVRDLSMTTNGVLLGRHAAALRAAGLHRLNISLDTLRPQRFMALSRRDDHAAVLAGIRAAGEADFTGSKLDAVILRGVNDDELADLVEFGMANSCEVRFLEYMDVGGATGWKPELVFSRAEMLDALAARYGPVTPVEQRTWAPADRFRLPDGTTFGIISATTQPFCRTCDRSRLTADGLWYRCLYALHGTDLRTPLRAGATPAELAATISDTWRTRRDRGAEDRLRLQRRRELIPVAALKADPHLEMHTRGG